VVPLARGLRRGRDLEQEQRRKNELCFVYHRESPCRADVADSGRVCCVTGSNGQVVHRDRYRPRELSQANLMTKQIAGETWSHHAKDAGAICGGAGKDSRSIGGSPEKRRLVQTPKPKYYFSPVCSIMDSLHIDGHEIAHPRQRI
jgi:hypothetical protein